jgi:hypothetical protein
MNALDGLLLPFFRNSKNFVTEVFKLLNQLLEKRFFDLEHKAVVHGREAFLSYAVKYHVLLAKDRPFD